MVDLVSVGTEQKTLRASDFIKKLQRIIDERGDLPLYLCDPDTEFLLGVDLETAEALSHPGCLEIVADYAGGGVWGERC